MREPETCFQSEHSQGGLGSLGLGIGSVSRHREVRLSLSAPGHIAESATNEDL